MNKIKSKKFSNLLLLVMLSSNASFAESSKSETPYIDLLKRQMRESGQDKNLDSDASAPEKYINSLKKYQIESDRSGLNYTEKLKKTFDPEPPVEKPYTETIKERLEPKAEGGAIQAVLEGRSEIKEKKRGDIHWHAGLRYVVTANRQLKSSTGFLAAGFNSVYSSYAPDFTFFYEWQPFHSEWFGNLGIVAMAGLGYFTGFGQYAYPVPKPGGVGGTFSLNSPIAFTFLSIPVTVAAVYRFNLLRIVRPYIMAGPMAVGYIETRSDQNAGHRAYSFSWMGSIGTSILLDWMSKSDSWDLYATHGVHHYYLNVDYTWIFPFPGDIQYSNSGVTVGLSYEF